ncbi:MAG: peptidase, partial [Mycobacteriaceae bacterium]|nr:peptidase [Mycobacteriaceae bacterium]
DALRRLYLLACGPDHPDLTAAVRGALGIEMSELQGAWAGWLSR